MFFWPLLSKLGVIKLVETLVKSPMAERRYRSPEMVNPEKIARIGRQAIISAEQLDFDDLGINDPLTHLYKYQERGRGALVVIEEDVVRDVAERLPQTPFVSNVGFEFTGDDFVSAKDRVSMRIMTENNLCILQAERVNKKGLSEEVARAEVETQEVEKLSEWFADAPIGSFLVFESLPIGKQKVTISRIYQKQDDHHLDGSFVSLYDPSVETFNSFRKKMGLGKSDCENELEVLENEYEVQNPGLASMDQFIESYVETYDRVLDQKTGETHSFGLKKDEKAEVKNGMEKVQSQPNLTSIYINAIKSLNEGRDRVSHGLVHIDEQLGLGFKFREGEAITIQTKRRVLQEVIMGITSAIDRADVDLLFDIEQPDSSLGMGYAAVSHFAAEARSEGVSYESNACPENSFSNESESKNGASLSEFNILLGAFNPMDIPNKFGRPKIGVCRVNNCPTRGESKYIHNQTLVGGCDICIHCHKIFEKGKSPEKIYDEKIKAEQQKQKQAKEDVRRVTEKEEVEERRKQKIITKKQKQMRIINKQKNKRKKPNFFDVKKKAA